MRGLGEGEWRRERDSNPRYPDGYNRFRVCRNRPLCHLSAVGHEREILSGAWCRQACGMRSWRPMPLFFGQPERTEDFAQLGAHRQRQVFAGRRAALEPAPLDPLQLAALGEAPERALDDRGELRIVLAEHDAVGVVGEVLADDLVFALLA